MGSGWVFKNTESNGCKHELKTLKAPIKLSRKTAIFEFSSSNGFSSFTLDYECRHIAITEIEDENQNYFSYLVLYPYQLWSHTACEERGYEEWYYYCITTFQGLKCSMNHIL